jgi:hypothetical protein
MSLPQFIQGNNHAVNENLAKIKTLKKNIDLYGNPIKAEKAKSKIPFENAYIQDCYKFIAMPGNNSVVIRKAMERRSWWIEI